MATKKTVEEKKLAPSELAKFNNYIDQQDLLLKEIGKLKLTETQLVNKTIQVTQAFNKFKNELQEIYGKINVDLQTGSFTKIIEYEPNKED